MKAYSLTLAEYKETVSPLIKEFKKFIRKNKTTFAKTVGYYGFIHHTIESYIQSAIDDGIRILESRDDESEWALEYYGYKKETERATEKWLELGGSTEKPSAEVLEEYYNLLETLTFIFGESINRVESDETNSNKRSVRRAIDNDSYVNDMLDGKITPQEVENIISSVGIKMSKRLKDMKTKVETEGYNRNSEDNITAMKSNISNQVKTMLEPYTDRLEMKKENEITSLVNGYLESGITDTYEYAKTLTSNYNEYYELDNSLGVFIDSKTSIKRDNFDKLLEIAKKNYVDLFISKFVTRFDDKISVASKSLGEPIIDFTEVNFRGANLVVNADVEFPSGDSVYCETSVIFAGGQGTMQILHQRYLMKFTKNGKKISLEQLDSLQA